MKQLSGILEDYLSSIDRFGELGLGERPRRVVKKNDNQHLAKALDQRLKFNKHFVVVILMFLCILFVVATSFLFFYRHDVKVFYGVFGALLLSNFGIIKWLRQLWWEMNTMDISLYVLRELPPEEAAAFISRLYWDFVRSSSRRAGKSVGG
ncbi:MAG: hypothetical protein AABN95_07545 [Acidobacteriota bacterium]